jgi:cell division protein FtsB
VTSPSGRSSGATRRRYASPGASGSPGRGRPRPTSAARSTASGAARRPARPSPERTLRGYAKAHTVNFTLTTRAALLGLALCAVVLTLAYPAREYLAQRRQINQLTAQVADDKRNLAAEQLAGRRDADPDYVEVQARERLHMQRPGDQVFQLPPPPKPKIGKQTAGAVKTPVLPGRNSQPWYQQLYRSTVESGK